MSSLSFLREAFANTPKFPPPKSGKASIKPFAATWPTPFYDGLTLKGRKSTEFSEGDDFATLPKSCKGVVHVEYGVLAKTNTPAVVVTWYISGVLVGQWIRNYPVEDTSLICDVIYSAVHSLENASHLPGLMSNYGYKPIHVNAAPLRPIVKPASTAEDFLKRDPKVLARYSLNAFWYRSAVVLDADGQVIEIGYGNIVASMGSLAFFTSVCCSKDSHNLYVLRFETAEGALQKARKLRSYVTTGKIGNIVTFVNNTGMEKLPDKTAGPKAESRGRSRLAEGFSNNPTEMWLASVDVDKKYVDLFTFSVAGQERLVELVYMPDKVSPGISIHYSDGKLLLDTVCSTKEEALKIAWHARQALNDKNFESEWQVGEVLTALVKKYCVYGDLVEAFSNDPSYVLSKPTLDHFDCTGGHYKKIPLKVAGSDTVVYLARMIDTDAATLFLALYIKFQAGLFAGPLVKLKFDCSDAAMFSKAGQEIIKTFKNQEFRDWILVGKVASKLESKYLYI